MKTLLGRPINHVYQTSHKNFLDEEEWFNTNDSGGATWVELGYTHGYWSAGNDYNGAFWAYNPTTNQSKYKASTLSAIAPYPVHNSSYYSFKITEVSATQATFNVAAEVFSHSGGFKALASANTPTNNPHTHKAFSGTAGIETTCGYNQTTSQWVSLNGQTVSDKSQGSWHHWPNYHTPGGYNNPMRVSWYDTAHTGKKLKVSENNT
jgi:hypothetical protein